jgi:hypothetical protein
MRISPRRPRQPERLAYRVLRLGILGTFCCPQGWPPFYVSPVAARELSVPSPTPFTAVSTEGDVAPIVLQRDAASQTGFDWNVIKKLRTDDRRPNNAIRASVEYLVEGIQRMTDRTPTVQNGFCRNARRS